MFTKTYPKQCNAFRLQTEIITAGLAVSPTSNARFYGVNVNSFQGASWETNVLFFDDITSEEIIIVDNIVDVHIPIPIIETPYPVDVDGKSYVRAEPRPLNCTTIFTNAGDTLNPASIGTGNKLLWNASISGDWTTEGAPDGFKQKTIDLMFVDMIYTRGGHVHSVNAIHGSYLDMYIMCPPTGWYYINGVLTQNNTENYIIIDHNVIGLPLLMASSVLNLDSQTASQGIPSYYKIRAVITIPVSDIISNGSAMLMMYRSRTIVI